VRSSISQVRPPAHPIPSTRESSGSSRQLAGRCLVC
jgi:hypothetical protein